MVIVKKIIIKGVNEFVQKSVLITRWIEINGSIN